MVLQNWVSMVVDLEAELGPECFGRDAQIMTSYLYVNNGLLVSTRASRLLQEFHVLTELFNQVCLCTNTGNMVSTPYRTKASG